MSISSNSWFSSVYQTWLGTQMSQTTWESFLTDSDVQQLAANDTADYRRLYLQKFISSTFSQDSVVQALTQEVLPGATSEETQELVQSFFELPQVTALPDSATKQSYYTLYWAYLFEMTILNDPDTAQWYSSTTEQFLGTDAGNSLPQILASFLATPAVQSLPQSATTEDYQRLYIQYLSSSVNQTHLAEMVTGQSPEAIQQYKVLWSVFELLARMLDAMTISQIRNAIAVHFFVQKRSSAASAYEKAPIYVGKGVVNVDLINDLKDLFENVGSNPILSSIDSVFTPINVDLSDPSKFTLGYGNISLQDVTDWLYAQASSSSTGESSFNLYSGDYVLERSILDGKTVYTFAKQVLTLSVQNINGSPVVTANLVQYSDPWVKIDQEDLVLNDDGSTSWKVIRNYNTDGSINWEYEKAAGNVTTTPVMSVTLSPTNNESSVKEALNGAFTQLWDKESAILMPTDSNTLSSFELETPSVLWPYFLAARTPKIAWSRGILATSFNKKPSDPQRTALAKFVQDRGAANELISSELSSLSANMDVLKSMTNQQSQVQSASSSEEKMTVDAMRSVILVLQQILSAFFT